MLAGTVLKYQSYSAHSLALIVEHIYLSLIFQVAEVHLA